MYAIADIKGFQYKLEKGDTLRIPRHDVEIGKKIKIPEVLLVSDKDKISIGIPYVEGVVVEATVTGHNKEKKIIVFKKKRRKDYSVKKGHRQEFTEIVIDKISVSKPKKTTKVSKSEKTTKSK
jgi:large subunit ribosomal protein L21